MNKLTQVGEIDGTTVTITSNPAGTHFYSNGKRVSREIALKAIDTVATKIAPKKKPAKPAPEAKPAPRKQNVASFKRIDVSVNDLVSGAQVYAKVKAEKKIDAKLALLKTIDEKVATFLLFWNKNATAVGFSGKRFAKKLDAIHQVNEECHCESKDTVNLRALNDVLLNIVEGGTRFELSTEEFEEIAKTLPVAILAHSDILITLGDVISGKTKLGLPSNKL